VLLMGAAATAETLLLGPLFRSFWCRARFGLGGRTDETAFLSHAFFGLPVIYTLSA
jgi:hypothetical protein